MTKLITILGPTASGKTALAATLAVKIGGEIISADSRQVYRRMDIGTGKDLADYNIDGVKVKHHLIDIAEPGSKYNLYKYQRDAAKAYFDIVRKGAVPILCGGTGLYIEAVLRGYKLARVDENKELRARLAGKSIEELTEILSDLKKKNGSTMHNTTDIDTAKRAIRAIEIETHNLLHPQHLSECPAVEAVVIGTMLQREERRRRISQRLRERIEGGMVEEVQSLLDEGIAAEDLMYYGLEYKFVTEYLIGQTTKSEMTTRLETAIHQFAKRQMTWFRGMERRGTAIHWIDATLPMETKVAKAIEIIRTAQ